MGATQCLAHDRHCCIEKNKEETALTEEIKALEAALTEASARIATLQEQVERRTVPGGRQFCAVEACEEGVVYSDSSSCPSSPDSPAAAEISARVRRDWRSAPLSDKKLWEDS